MFAEHFTYIDERIGEINKVELGGYICKPPVCRKTPLGREVADILLAVNNPYFKSYYIPCICWGRNANYAGGLAVGTRIQIEGRIQSREYNKRLYNGMHDGNIEAAVYETRTAYEVSVNKIEEVLEVEN